MLNDRKVDGSGLSMSQMASYPILIRKKSGDWKLKEKGSINVNAGTQYTVAYIVCCVCSSMC